MLAYTTLRLRVRMRRTNGLRNGAQAIGASENRIRTTEVGISLKDGIQTTAVKFRTLTSGVNGAQEE